MYTKVSQRICKRICLQMSLPGVDFVFSPWLLFTELYLQAIGEYGSIDVVREHILPLLLFLLLKPRRGQCRVVAALSLILSGSLLTAQYSTSNYHCPHGYSHTRDNICY